MCRDRFITSLWPLDCQPGRDKSVPTIDVSALFCQGAYRVLVGGRLPRGRDKSVPTYLSQ